MESPSSYRERSRARLRDDLIAAARELAVSRGWSDVRVADVARAAGVSRQTVYNEFGDKAGLTEALASAEVEQFVTEVQHRLLDADNVRDGAYAAIRHTLDEAGRNPLINSILTSARGGTDELLPYLTTRSDMVLQAAGAVVESWLSPLTPQLPAEIRRGAVDAVVRLTVSHIVLPGAPAEQTAMMLADLLVRLVRDGSGPT
jgi:AcrR family transcriptional regulator